MTAGIIKSLLTGMTGFRRDFCVALLGSSPKNVADLTRSHALRDHYGLVWSGGAGPQAYVAGLSPAFVHRGCVV